MTIDNLTEKQLQLLNYIRSYYADHEVGPSLREMAARMKVKDLKGIREYLDRLERKGYVVRNDQYQRSVVPLSAENIGTVPVYGKVAAGLPIDIAANVDRMVTIPDDLFRTRPDFLLQISGDSMVDIGIYDGDLAGIKRCRAAQHGQIVVAMVDADEMSREERKECGLNNTGITLKRLVVSGNKLLLKSENRERNYSPIIVKPERVRIEGRFVGLARGS